jgi:hypothetical protein
MAIEVVAGSDLSFDLGRAQLRGLPDLRIAERLLPGLEHRFDLAIRVAGAAQCLTALGTPGARVAASAGC